MSRTAGGRPLGATMACHEVTSTFLTPASASVGTSGSTGERFGAGDGQRAHLAALDVLQHRVDVLERRVDLAAHQVGDARARRPCTARGRPWCRSAARTARWSGGRSCRCRPRRSSSCPGLAFSYAMTSATLLCGELAGTTSTLGDCTATVIRSKSFSASYCMPLIRCGTMTSGPSEVTRKVSPSGAARLTNGGADGAGGAGLVVDDERLLELVGRAAAPRRAPPGRSSRPAGRARPASRSCRARSGHGPRRRPGRWRRWRAVSSWGCLRWDGACGACCAGWEAK